MTRPIRLAVATTHPIQYQAPWFRALARRPEVDVTVFFAMIPDAQQQGAGFGVAFEWDIPLLDGYRHVELENRARRPSLGRFLGCHTPGIARALDGFDAVIVHGWGVRSAIQTLWAARRRGLPCILRGESSALRPWPHWRRRAYAALLSNYSAFLAIGRANRDFYVRHGISPKRIFDAPYCIDNDRFGAAAAALAPRRKELRRAFGMSEDAIVVAFSGKLVDKKRPLDLINALSLARRREPRLHLLVAGEGPLRAACEARAAEAGVPSAFLGFLNQREIARAYVAADYLVLPSDYGETWGLVVNEAMACGRPAIVSDRVGCGPDLVLPGETGAVFPFGNVSALAHALAALAATPDAALRMGARARERVRAHYSIEVLVEGTLAALRFATAGIR